MEHPEAKNHLIDFVDGRCDWSTRTEVASHVEQCSGCRTWVETHHLLASVLSGFSGDNHPDSDALASFVLRPEESIGPTELVDKAHIESCAICSRDVEIVRSAVHQARAEAERVNAQALTIFLPVLWKIAAAACLVLGVLWLVHSTETWRSVRLESPMLESVAPAPNRKGLAPGRHDLEFSDIEIEGSYRLEADDRMTLTRIKIKEGAEVTIVAREGVAFADGFQVGEEARLVVGVSASDPGGEVPHVGKEHG